MRLRQGFWNGEIIQDYPMGPMLLQGSLQVREGGSRIREEDVTTSEAEWHDEGHIRPCWRGSQARGCRWPLEAGRIQETDFPPESPKKKKKRMQPCPDFDLGPLGILSEFWSLNLCCFNHCYFGVKFVAVCYSNNSELCSVSSQTNMLTLSFPLLAPWDVDTGSGGMAAFL